MAATVERPLPPRRLDTSARLVPGVGDVDELAVRQPVDDGHHLVRRVGLDRRRPQLPPVGREQRTAQVAGEPGTLLRLGGGDPFRRAATQVVPGVREPGGVRLVLPGRLRIVPLLHAPVGRLPLDQAAYLVLQLVVQARTMLAAASFHTSRSTLDWLDHSGVPAHHAGTWYQRDLP